MAFYSLTPVSGNAKTGPIATSVTSADTCPDSCGFKAKGCYAKYGPASMHWGKVTDGTRGGDFAAFLQAIDCLPRGGMLRHNVAGDLPGLNESVNSEELRQIGAAVSARRLIAWTYTHKHSQSAVIAENRGGMVVNLSADNVVQADSLSGNGLPVVTVLPAEYENEKRAYTPAGRLVVVCPAARKDSTVTCQTCGNGKPLCARADREYLIGFPAHGTAKKTVSLIATVELA